MVAIRALTIADVRNIRRDSFLQFMLIYPLILGVMMRWLIPFMTEGMTEIIDLTVYYPLLAALFGVLLGPMLMGVVVGFLLLDERDARTLVALRVTPLSLRNYLVYRLFLPMLVGLASAYIVLPLINLVPVSLLAVTPMALLGGLGGPIYTLLLASLAGNKVQGLALMKALGMFVIVPVAAWFVPEPWQWLAGVLPSYWPAKAFWVMLEGGDVWPYLLLGLVINLCYLALLLRQFNRRMARLHN